MWIYAAALMINRMIPLNVLLFVFMLAVSDALRSSFVGGRAQHGAFTDGTVGMLLQASSQDAVPQVNPHVDPNAFSLSGVSYESVLTRLDRIYPSQELHIRNAKSRTDGYWAYVSKGEEPPMDLTYGEFDFHFFAQLLDKAHWYFYENQPHAPSNWDGCVFCDLGSGTGRLVLGAAALHPGWKVCRGIELLEGIHELAVEKLQPCYPHSGGEAATDTLTLPSTDTSSAGVSVPGQRLTMAPVELRCGSFDDPYELIGDTDCAFVFSSCFSTDLMERLAKAIGRQLRPGAIVITTDYMLPLEGYIEPIEGDPAIPSGK